MTQTPAEPPRVLNYDPRTRSYKASRLWGRIVLVLVCGAVGAFGGFLLSFGPYRAVVYVNIPQDQQQAAVTAMRSPASLTAGVVSARRNGGALTPQQISEHLAARAMPGSQLVEVVVTWDQPEMAAAIVGGVVNNYVASNSAARVVGGSGIPTNQQPQPMIILAGAVAGLVGGWIIVTLRRR